MTCLFLPSQVLIEIGGYFIREYSRRKATENFPRLVSRLRHTVWLATIGSTIAIDAASILVQRGKWSFPSQDPRQEPGKCEWNFFWAALVLMGLSGEAVMPSGKTW
jgi:hypothetical protein